MFLILLPLSIAFLNWLGISRGWKRLEFITKPGTIIGLLIWIWLVVPNPFASPILIWIQIGLTLSMVGDVLLMLPKEQFIGGLVAFLLAHLAYIIGLNLTPPILNPLSVGSVIVVSVIGIGLYRGIERGLIQSGNERLQKPVLIYAIVISLMLISALWTHTRPQWSLISASLMSGGAGLFFVSDTLLAWNRFVKPLNNGRLLVRVTYHLGQFGIALGTTRLLLT